MTMIRVFAPPKLNPTSAIGTEEMNVPKTGMNPKTNTSNANVEMKGKIPSGWVKPMMISPIVVRTALTKAMIAWALKISQNPLVIFSEKSEN